MLVIFSYVTLWSVKHVAAQHVWIFWTKTKGDFWRPTALWQRWSYFKLSCFSFLQFTQNLSGAFHDHTHYTSMNNLTAVCSARLWNSGLKNELLQRFCIYTKIKHVCVPVNHTGGNKSEHVTSYCPSAHLKTQAKTRTKTTSNNTIVQKNTVFVTHTFFNKMYCEPSKFSQNVKKHLETFL